MESIADVEIAHIPFDRLRKILGQTLDLDCVEQLLELSSQFHAQRLTVQDDGYLGCDLGGFIDGQEIGMEDVAAERIVL